MNNKFDSVLEKYLKENNPNIAAEIDALKKNASAAPQIQQKITGAAVEGMADALSKADPKLLELANSIKEKILTNKDLTPDEVKVLQDMFSKNNKPEEIKPEEKTQNQQQQPQDQKQTQQPQQQPQQNSITYNPNK
jgi:hypothetical protein